MTEDGLDREIDLALQEMVGGDGPGDLRRRVLERLAEPPPRVASRRVMLAAAATIALAVAKAVVFRGPVAHPSATMSAHRHGPAAAPISPPPASAGPPPPTETARPRGSSTWRPAGRPPAPELLVPDEGEADAIGIEPIEVSPLAVAPMETQRWAIAPLRIEPMQIEPLAEPQP